MRLARFLTIGTLAFAVCFCLGGQTAPPQEGPVETKGLPARATPADYMAHAETGGITLAADFMGHSIPTQTNVLTTEDYVVVEVALFGAPGARATLSLSDFTLRINGKRNELQSQPYGLLAGALKDPDWEPPTSGESKSKASVGSSGSERAPGDPPPPPVRIPVPVQRAMMQRVQKVAFVEGDRPLPQAGLLFFRHRGKITSIKSVELVYNGAGGKITLQFNP